MVEKRKSPGAKNKKNRSRSRVWERVSERAAGIDAGSEYHFVCVPEESGSPSVRKFRTNTRGLYELADWLAQCGVETVAVEATGVYSMPLLEILDARSFDVVLAKPSSLKSVNDRRKSDMMDCQWIQLLHTFGLLKGSYRPKQEIAVYRTLNRQKQTLVEQSSTEIEHIKKSLTEMNVRLDSAVSDVMGVTGQAIIRAIVAGERDPAKLAALRNGGCAKSQEQIEDDLTGRWADHHLFVLGQSLRKWDHIRELLAECHEQMRLHLESLAKKTNRATIPPVRRKEHVRKTVLPFDAREVFYELLGQDLTQIPGVGTNVVSAFIAEVGTDVSAFKTVKHFSSWLKASPGTNRSGKRDRSGRNKKTSNRFFTALRVAAQTLANSKTALGGFYRRKRAQIGPQKAINATAHKLARMIYYTLRYDRTYVDPGEHSYTERERNRLIKKMEKRARQLGYELVKAA